MIKKKIMHTQESMLVVLFCIPLFGTLMICAYEYYERKNKFGKDEISVEKLKIEDIKYQSIITKDNSNADIAVPLEEAMLVNDTKTQRRLMMDVLQYKPQEYVHVLQRARLSEDSELSHYATTTMMQIQSDYELRIHDLEALMDNHPNDKKLMKEYRKVLNEYMKSGLLSGSVQKVYQVKLRDILKRLMEENPEKMRYTLEYIECCLEEQEYDGLEEIINAAKERWPEEELVYQRIVDYYWRRAEGDKIREVLREIQDKNIYLSHEGRKWFDFWNDREM
ncbi:MAG: hypothetical protein IJW18_02585 [Lachnospiraceae bacterium]|nr:hypothetical protein [Lachnospiraceae bacterium]